jgi:hypothetical protein
MSRNLVRPSVGVPRNHVGIRPLGSQGGIFSVSSGSLLEPIGVLFCVLRRAGPAPQFLQVNGVGLFRNGQ